MSSLVSPSTHGGQAPPFGREAPPGGAVPLPQQRVGPGRFRSLHVSGRPESSVLTATVDPITNTRGLGLEDLLVALLSPPAEREERQPNAGLIILASSRVSEVPAMVNLNFHAMVHRDAIYFKESINPHCGVYQRSVT